MKKLFLLLLLGSGLSALAQNVSVVSSNSLRLVQGTAINTADGTVTNSFGVIFGAVPVVVSVQTGLNTTITNVVEATTSNFVLRVGTNTGITNRWVAIGTL